jgi:hypothetical protein
MYLFMDMAIKLGEHIKFNNKEADVLYHCERSKAVPRRAVQQADTCDKGRKLGIFGSEWV